jgi:hypothetical protein
MGLVGWLETLIYQLRLNACLSLTVSDLHLEILSLPYVKHARNSDVFKNRSSEAVQFRSKALHSTIKLVETFRYFNGTFSTVSAYNIRFHRYPFE